jgi:hypothetical protein
MTLALHHVTFRMLRQIENLKSALAASRRELELAHDEVASSNVVLSSNAREISILQMALDDSRGKLTEARVGLFSLALSTSCPL